MYLAKPGEMMLWTPGVPWNLPRCPAQVMPTQEAGERLGTGFSKDRVGQVRDRSLWFVNNIVTSGLIVLDLGGRVPQGIFGNVWRCFWLSQLGNRYHWHLVGGGQEAAKPPTVHRTDPQQTLSQKQMLLALRLEAAPAFLEVSLALTRKN